MTAIDQAAFEFDQRFGALIGLMVAVMVFGVALDLRWQQLRRVFIKPKAPVIGLIGQIVVLPAVAWAVGMALVDTPSVALGLLLVASSPGGAVSNYLAHLARADVATSVAMTAISTIACVIFTPLLLVFWGSLNPDVNALLLELDVDAKMVAIMFAVTIAVPIAAGMAVRARRPATADRIRPWVGRVSLVLLIAVVTFATVNYIGVIVEFAVVASVPVIITFTTAVLLGLVLALLLRTSIPERRAIVIEVGGQNVSIGVAMAVAFFPTLAGAAIPGAAWAFVQNVVYLPLVALWRKLPGGADGAATGASRPS